MSVSRFNIRVYGIWIDEDDKVLLSDEFFRDTYMTKFPGGGLELGEGTIDGLKREWREEAGVEIEVLDHFYTTDFFQKSAFHIDAQIMSIYYLVSPVETPDIEFKTQAMDFDVLEEGAETFRKVPLSTLKEDDLTFPIDKKVVQLLHKHGGRSTAKT
ncbi:MAG TPA: NUDIX domain-containing protein [Flavobacteriales bacterium]|nr:NUDIX domain-containing protein [Flavobacteriales bacterium]HIO67732.1 NUDIX domain-containing protein [Flavobacteriales bacterium]